MTKEHKRLNEVFWAICARQDKEQKEERLEYYLSQIDTCLYDAESSLDDLNDDLKQWKKNIITMQEQEEQERIEHSISFVSSCVEAARKLLIELEQELENQRS